MLVTVTKTDGVLLSLSLNPFFNRIKYDVTFKVFLVVKHLSCLSLRIKFDFSFYEQMIPFFYCIILHCHWNIQRWANALFVGCGMSLTVMVSPFTSRLLLHHTLTCPFWLFRLLVLNSKWEICCKLDFLLKVCVCAVYVVYMSTMK